MEIYRENGRRQFFNLRIPADIFTVGFLARARKSRVKAATRKLLLDKNIWRILLIFSMLFYLPALRFAPAEKKEIPEQAYAAAENGMGGGVNPEELNSELGVPEPIVYLMPHMLTFASYTLEKGDIIGNIAMGTGLNEDTLISVNNIRNTRLLQIGQAIRIPNQDGIYYTIKTGDTLEDIAETYKTTVSAISTTNELFSDKLAINTALFIPGARLDWVNRQEINGDLFIWPCTGYISSNYGYRIAPFGGTRQMHSGIDIAASMGSPVRAAMAGQVIQVGNDDYWGNHILIRHHSGYRTFYAHMSAVRIKNGAYVATGERIGDIGSTGLSTGPHLHFTVYKNNVTVNPRTLMR